MKNHSLLYGIYFLIISVATAVAIALRSVAVLVDMNYETSYFEDKLLIGIADKIVIAAIVFALTYVFLESRDKKLIFDFNSPLNYVFGGTLGVALLFFSRHAFSVYGNIRAYLKTYVDNGTQKILMFLALAAAILSLLAVLHFLLGALIIKERNAKRADFGLITVMFLACYAAYLYFSSELPINAPSKIIDQAAYLFSSVFFLYETRISIGRERWKPYRAFGFISMLLCAYSSLPALIAYTVNGVLISNSIYESVLTLAIFLFVSARLVLTVGLKEKKESPITALIKSAAIKREAELSPVPEAEESPDVSEEFELEDKGEYYELHFDADEGVNNSDEEITE